MGGQRAHVDLRELGPALTIRMTLPTAARCQFDERNRTRKLLYSALGVALFSAAAG